MDIEHSALGVVGDDSESIAIASALPLHRVLPNRCDAQGLPVGLADKERLFDLGHL
ncbi:hypothetical protein D9M73_260710 [compost metagenome]